MAYKTIFTALTDLRQLPQLDAAASLAVREDGHLDILCIGVDHSQAGYYFPGGTPYAFQESIDAAMEAAETLEKELRAHLAGASICAGRSNRRWRRSAVWAASSACAPASPI